ncbi:MAG: hypothetical protein K2Q03_09325 [Sphingobacteriaceae bacterium]|nr:hypothetical protein [Sphingobacteriaceae bacterium]
MKKFLFIFIFILFSKLVFAYEIEIKELRNLYYASIASKKNAEKLHSIVDRKQDLPILLAYKGVANLLIAKHAFNPVNKFKYFNLGKKDLELAVKKDILNIEIRFLRYCSQTNIPFFLGYNDDIENDKKVILSQWQFVEDEDLKQKIKNYMNQSKYCSKTDKLTFK